ncbi:MAG: redoxin domain-containing protein [Amnibacterium sp.]
MSGRRRPETGLVIAWGGAAVAVAVAVALVVVLLLPAPAPSSAAQTAGPASTGLDATESTLLAVEPVKPAPAPGFTLTDQRAHPSSLGDFRGRAVVLSFNDDRCTDICTLLAQVVAAADRDLGATRAHVAFVSVNANPYHPSVADVRSWTDAHGLGAVPNWTYDTGSPARLAAVAKAYGETVRLDPTTRTIEHGTDLVFIDPAGEERLIGLYGTETADTAAFGHALADAAVSMLPAGERGTVGGAEAAPPSSGSGIASLPRLGGHGAPVSLRNPGRFTVLTFFSSTCTACRSELPGIEREHRSAKGRTAFVGVDVADSAAAAQRLLASTGVSYPVGVDATGAAAARFGATGLPYTVILDPSGRAVTTHPGLLTADQLHYLLQVLPAAG